MNVNNENQTDQNEIEIGNEWDSLVTTQAELKSVGITYVVPVDGFFEVTVEQFTEIESALAELVED